MKKCMKDELVTKRVHLVVEVCGLSQGAQAECCAVDDEGDGLDPADYRPFLAPPAPPITACFMSIFCLIELPPSRCIINCLCSHDSSSILGFGELCVPGKMMHKQPKEADPVRDLHLWQPYQLTARCF